MTLDQPTTMYQWIALQLRAIATKLEGATITPPTVTEIKRDQLRAAQIALLDNEAEVERYTQTAAMLRKRIARLSE